MHTDTDYIEQMTDYIEQMMNTYSGTSCLRQIMRLTP